jgi:hypothetical protein
MMKKDRFRPMVLLGVLSLVLAACASVVPGSGSIPADTPTETRLSEPSDTDIVSTEDAEVTSRSNDEDEADVNTQDNPFAGVNLAFNPAYWPTTDFTKHSIDYSEIFSGGPPPDGIPSIDSPVFESVDAADTWLEADWPVMFFENDGDVRAYPLTILIYHEIVNDVVGQPCAAERDRARFWNDW